MLPVVKPDVTHAGSGEGRTSVSLVTTAREDAVVSD